MAPVLIGSCQLEPGQEWTAGAQAVRDVVNQRWGSACISTDMTIASANGWVYSWLQCATHAQSSAASVQWPCVAYELTALPSSNNALGPLHVQAGAAAGAPWNMRMGAYIELLDESLNLLASSNPLAAPLGSWQLMRPEWDTNNNRVRIWLWNAGTSVWDLYIDYDHGSTLGGTMKFGWGWQNYKAASLSCIGRIQDVLWLDDAGDWPNMPPATPWECYPSFPNANGTYSAWAGDWSDVDDWAAGGSLDANVISCVAADVKESHNFPNGIAPGNRPIVGVAFGHYWLSGVADHLIVADGAEETAAIQFTSPDSIVRSRTPAGNLWTPALVDGTEYGVESLGATEVDATHICVAECELGLVAAEGGERGLWRGVGRGTLRGY